MLLFILSLIGLILSAVTLAGTTALWVYKDAKARSANAGVWAILCLVVFPVGLIIYLVAGRPPKSEGALPQKKRFITAIVVLAVLLVVSTSLLIVSVTSGDLAGFGSVSSGAFIMSNDWYSNGQWSFSARSANGRSTRSPTLSAEELNSMFVTNANSNGIVGLKISQGDFDVTVDITGNYSDKIDMSGFSPGKVKLQLIFSKASNVSTSIRWR